MTAVCCALAEAAIARGNSFADTMPGSSAWMVGISKGRARREQNRQHGVAGERVARGADGKRERRSRLAQLADGDDEPTVEQIGDLADDDREPHQRQELHQPDQAEIEGIVGELVDLPTHRDALHHVGAVGEGARAPEQHERAVARQRRGGGKLGHACETTAEWRGACRSAGCRE
jgi:hypothetical protein